MSKVDLFLRIISTAATLIIGIAASLLAYQQFRISKAKLKFDLYEKRLALFKVAHDFAVRVANSFDAQEIRDATDRFAQDRVEARFLFDDPDVRFLFNELYLNAHELAALIIDDVSSDSDLERDKRWKYLRLWFSSQSIDMDEVFKNQLSIKTLN